MQTNQTLATIDPFNPELSVRARRALVGAKCGFAMDLAWCSRVLNACERARRGKL